MSRCMLASSGIDCVHTVDTSSCNPVLSGIKWGKHISLTNFFWLLAKRWNFLSELILVAVQISGRSFIIPSLRNSMLKIIQSVISSNYLLLIVDPLINNTPLNISFNVF